MKVTVLKGFPYSIDPRGLEILQAAPGELDLPEDMVPGLVSEGYIAQPEDMPPVAISAGRRKVIIDRVTELFRAHMEALSDEQLTETLGHAERQSTDASERAAYATKVSEELEHGQAELFSVEPSLAGLAAIADADLTVHANELFDVRYRNPASGEQLADKGLTKEAADARAKELGEMDEPAADIQVVPHVSEPPLDIENEHKTALPAIDIEAADESALRAFLTARDGKNPDLRFGVDRLRALAKATPGDTAEPASE